MKVRIVYKDASIIGYEDVKEWRVFDRYVAFKSEGAVHIVPFYNVAHYKVFNEDS